MTKRGGGNSLLGRFSLYLSRNRLNIAGGAVSHSYSYVNEQPPEPAKLRRLFRALRMEPQFLLWDNERKYINHL